MQFQEGYIYHIFNQGNNRRKIFFSRRNYLFFTGKIRMYIQPYADILAWCLMPNHFHLMVRVNHLERPVAAFPQSRSSLKTRILNDSIGLMLRSYTSAINKPRISNRKSQALFIADRLRISSVLAYTKTVNS